MARLISLNSSERGEIYKFEGSHIVFMLCMILVSMSILSMIIFACGDSYEPSSHKKVHRRHRRSSRGVLFGGTTGGDAGGGGGCGGGGGGGCGGGGGGG
ncbi:hypothetical protein Tco_0847126 [Tanacetum coccineum]